MKRGKASRVKHLRAANLITRMNRIRTATPIPSLAKCLLPSFRPAIAVDRHSAITIFRLWLTRRTELPMRRCAKTGR